MKDLYQTTTTLLIVFITLKLIDFSNLSLLDCIILVLVVILFILSIISFVKKRGDKD